MTIEPLLLEIRDFLAETGMSPSYFGAKAARNSALVKRLEAGQTVTLVTAQRVRNYMREARHREDAA